MPVDEPLIQSHPELLKDIINVERSLLRLSLRIQTRIKKGINSFDQEMQKEKNDSQEYSTAFENYDQKANQLFSLLSTVIRSMREMQSATTRNML